MTDGITPSQTVGPFFAYCLTPEDYDFRPMFSADLTRPDLAGERIRIEGRVTDGDGAPVPDAVIEIWQADSAGLYNSPSEMRGAADPNFTGWGRCPTRAEDGVYSFETVKPGRVPFKDGRKMAPHITFWIVARGINIGLHTRMYVTDEAAANAEDPVLRLVEQAARRETLMAPRLERDGEIVYRFDIRVQGERETVFFDV